MREKKETDRGRKGGFIVEFFLLTQKMKQNLGIPKFGGMVMKIMAKRKKMGVKLIGVREGRWDKEN